MNPSLVFLAIIGMDGSISVQQGVEIYGVILIYRVSASAATVTVSVFTIVCHIALILHRFSHWMY